MSDRRAAAGWVEAIRGGDVSALRELAHPDIVVRYPQSGEVVKGPDNVLAMVAAIPFDIPDSTIALSDSTRETVSVIAPGGFAMPSITVTGAGDTFFVEGVADYGASGVFHTVMLIKVRDGKVAEETSYFAEPFERPDWRTPFAE